MEQVIITSSLPKVVLHDHLDGGLRAATLLELAEAAGYAGLPHRDPGALAAWFDQSRSGSLVRYLASFEQTVAVMQTPEALRRVAREAVEDLAADGVVYAEIRFAPSLHTRRGVGLGEAIDSVLEGIAEGGAATGTVAKVIVSAMRQEDGSEEVAVAAAAGAGRGVVGFDLAGPEGGYPASRHRRALSAAGESGLGLTIHAGEAAGPESIADALDCGAVRIGHGVQVIHDVVRSNGRILELGPIAARVLEGRTPLELCPSSNVHTSAVASAASHPLGMLHRAGFVVTVNTDNRLMSATSMGAELSLAADLLGLDGNDIRQVTMNAVEAAFCDEETRAALRRRLAGGWPPG